MSDYSIIAGLDRARYEALLNAEILHPLPQNAVLVIGADWCRDTQRSIMDSGYPTQTKDGRPIVYLNDANLEAHKLLGTLEGKEILGGGVDSPLPPGSERQYNYPTVVATRDGVLTEILYADTVPAGRLVEPEMMRSEWAAKEPALAAQRNERPKYDPSRGNELFAREHSPQVEPNHVYAFVRSNCGHCHELLVRSNYPTHTDDGRPITYLNLALTPDGKAPVDANAAHFFTSVLNSPELPGFPTFATTDANGKLSISAAGPSAIIEQFFPSVAQVEASRSRPAAPPVLEEKQAAPPPALEEVPAAPPPGLAQAEAVIRGLGKALNAQGLTASAPQTASGPAPTPVERSGESAARNA